MESTIAGGGRYSYPYHLVPWGKAKAPAGRLGPKDKSPHGLREEGKLMKSLMKIVAAAAVAVVASMASANAAPIRFGMAPEPYPPFASKDASGKWVGWEIELMDAVCKAMNDECKIVETSWDGIIPALQAKQIDVIWSSMSITNERKKVIDFTDKYYNTPTAIIGPKDEKFGVEP